MRTFGTTSWAARRGGHLTRGERGAELARGLLALARSRLQRAARRLGMAPRQLALAAREVELPRTPLAAAALAKLEQVPAWLAAHSLRTYAWGALLAVRDGVTWDDELGFAAAALHDLGLTCDGPEPCFAHRGAELARATCLAAGASAARAAQVADAICQHLNVAAPGGAEARLVRVGAGYDVAGDRFLELTAAQRGQVLARWPRADFAAQVSSSLQREAQRNPLTRAGFLCSTLRFPALIDRADRWFAREVPPAQLDLAAARHDT